MANYQVIAREMKGTSVTGYILDNGSAKMRVDLDQMAFLVGRNLVDNCEGKLFRDTLMIGGINGLKLNKLPSVKSRDTDDDKVKGSYAVSDSDINSEPEILYNITGIVKKGRVTVAYDTDTKGEMLREQVVKDAVDDKVGNLTTQMYNGSVLLRGVGINLKSLPVRQVESEDNLGKNTESQEKKEVSLENIIEEACHEVVEGKSRSLINDFATKFTPISGKEFSKKGYPAYAVDFGDFNSFGDDGKAARIVFRQATKSRAEILLEFRVFEKGKDRPVNRARNAFNLTYDIEANAKLILSTIGKLIEEVRLDVKGEFKDRYKQWMLNTEEVFKSVGIKALTWAMRKDYNTDMVLDKDYEIVKVTDNDTTIEYKMKTIDGGNANGKYEANFTILAQDDKTEGKNGILFCDIIQIIDDEKWYTKSGNSKVIADIKSDHKGIENDVRSSISFAIKDLDMNLSDDDNRHSRRETIAFIQWLKKDFRKSKGRALLKEFVGLKDDNRMVESGRDNCPDTTYVFSNPTQGLSAYYKIKPTKDYDGNAEVNIRITKYGDVLADITKGYNKDYTHEQLRESMLAAVNEAIDTAKNAGVRDDSAEQQRQDFMNINLNDEDVTIVVDQVSRIDDKTHVIPIRVTTTPKYSSVAYGIKFEINDETGHRFSAISNDQASMQLASLVNKALVKTKNKQYANVFKTILKKYIDNHVKLLKAREKND